MKYPCNIIDSGKISYRDAFHLQKRKFEEIKLGLTKDTILICEHFPVITLGRSGKISNLLVDSEVLKKEGIEFFKVDRGGDITCHELGQITVYPIFDLSKRNEKDIRFYLNRLEEVIKLALSHYCIDAKTVDGFTGVWVASRKISSIGVGISSWITYHGLSINIENSLKTFSFIKPCGMDIEMTSVVRELGHEVNLAEFKNVLLREFSNVFGLKTLILAPLENL